MSQTIEMIDPVTGEIIDQQQIKWRPLAWCIGSAVVVSLTR